VGQFLLQGFLNLLLEDILDGLLLPLRALHFLLPSLL
jgi:hypothetical protein